MDGLLSQNINSKKWLYGFIAIITILNILQAYLTGLHPDEAYYWVYAQFLDWGYFDHPPFVALFIKAGISIFHNSLGLRLITVLSYAASIYLLWLIVKKYVANVLLFILIISSILLFHVYSFITTPDVPLFFFSVLFIYCYQIYLKEDKIKWAILLAVICAGLMYSKYHGVLLIFFILLSNLNLFKRKSFYLVIGLAVVMCLPHLYWQYLNGYPSFYYHLIDRSATPYRFEYTAQYFLDQVLMMGPLVGWLLFYYGYQLKAQEDLFLRGLKFVFYGIFVFFFLSTFKGRVQAQWPLIEFIALFIMAYVYAGKNINHFVKYKWLFGINILLILLARFIIMGIIPLANQIKFVADFQNYDQWALQIKGAAQGKPVLFQDGFQDASYYNFYTQSLKGVAYNSINYRQTQYDLWPLAYEIQGKKVLLIGEGEATDKDSFNINTVKGIYNGTWIDSVRFYPKITFEPIDYPKEWISQEEKTITFKVKNPYQKSIDFNNQNIKWKCSFQYGYMLNGELISVIPIKTNIPNLKAQETKLISVKIKSPKESGDYKLFLSIKTEPFVGTRNSKMISIKVK
jgi:4-amino-4-deoxy-L-arabinose transferase-like glycosyltransferase